MAISIRNNGTTSPLLENEISLLNIHVQTYPLPYTSAPVSLPHPLPYMNLPSNGLKDTTFKPRTKVSFFTCL
jgi:hypothetical protein